MKYQQLNPPNCGSWVSAGAVTTTQTITINATYTEDGVTRTASLDVMITVAKLSSLSIQGTGWVRAGATSNYTATAWYDDGSQKTVNAAFSLASTSAATISPAGVLSAGAILTSQRICVNASYTEGGITKTQSLWVEISGRIIPISLTIQGPVSIIAGGKTQYTATAEYNDGTTKNVNAAFSLGSTSAATITSDGTLSTIGMTMDQTIAVIASYTEEDITRTGSLDVGITVQGVQGLSRSFNSFGELDSERTYVSGQTIYAYALTRDHSGSIATKTETVGGASTQCAYGYDSLGRLTSVTTNGQVVEEYQYGANGTRTLETNLFRGIQGRSLSYSEEDHLLIAGDTTFQYDLDGYLTTKTSGSQVTGYTYSSRGELLRVTLPDGKLIEYVTDPLGRRIAKKINGTITEKYLWKSMTQLLAVFDRNDNLLIRFLYADARMPLAMTKNGINYYLAYDQVGTLRTVADTSGNVVKALEYDSFGNILSDSDPSFTVPFAFAGGLNDPDTGLVRFGYRDYDPDVGRFISEDPLGFGGGDVNLFAYVDSVGKPQIGTNPYSYADSVAKPILETNLYTYAGNNPVRFIDPEGKFFIGAVVWAVVVAYTIEAIAPFWINTPMLPKGSPPGSLAPGLPGPVGPNPCPTGGANPPPIAGPPPLPPRPPVPIVPFGR